MYYSGRIASEKNEKGHWKSAIALSTIPFRTKDYDSSPLENFKIRLCTFNANYIFLTHHECMHMQCIHVIFSRGQRCLYDDCITLKFLKGYVFSLEVSVQYFLCFVYISEHNYACMYCSIAALLYQYGRRATYRGRKDNSTPVPHYFAQCIMS